MANVSMTTAMVTGYNVITRIGEYNSKTNPGEQFTASEFRATIHSNEHVREFAACSGGNDFLHASVSNYGRNFEVRVTRNLITDEVSIRIEGLNLRIEPQTDGSLRLVGTPKQSKQKYKQPDTSTAGNLREWTGGPIN